MTSMVDFGCLVIMSRVTSRIIFGCLVIMSNIEEFHYILMSSHDNVDFVPFVFHNTFPHFLLYLINKKKHRVLVDA